jgi:hypothetical protein
MGARGRAVDGADMPSKRIALLAAAAALALAPAAHGAPIETVVQDDALFLHGSDAEVADGLAKLRELGVDRLRLTAGWSVIAPDPDAATAPAFDAADPAAYPQGNWANLDRAVRMATAAGIRPMIDIAFWAPRWATTEPAGATARLRTGMDPARYAAFAHAVAERYSGAWRPAPGRVPPPEPSQDDAPSLVGQLLGGSQPAQQPSAQPAPAGQQPDPLPAVDAFTIWNEPNHPGFVMPQWAKEGGVWVAASADTYRAMVQAAYPQIKAVAPGAKVLIGGTSALGSDEPGTAGVPPLAFLRRLACVDDELRPVATGACAGFQPLPGDGWSHHPYSLRRLPDRVPANPDEVPVGALGRLSLTLQALVAMGRLAPADADLYLTEYGYETNPPDPQAPFSLADQGRLLAWGEDLGEQISGVRMWPQFLLRDRPGDPAGPAMRPFGDWQSGLLMADGTPKPAYATFRTPVHAECVRVAGRQWTRVWARLRQAPPGTQASVEVGGGGGRWRPTASAARASRPQRGVGRNRSEIQTLSGLPPRAGAAAVAAPAPGGTVVRFIPGAPPASVRVTWSLPGAPPIAGMQVAPTGCPSFATTSSTTKRRKA